MRVAAICIARFLVVPMVGGAAMFSLAKLGIIPTVTANPILWFFLLTQVCCRLSFVVSRLSCEFQHSMARSPGLWKHRPFLGFLNL